ncbi:MAG: CBS domain-containing protein [Anaerolineales bacterium]|nr:CBS domain-containing protein [Anaerolineales bacterium]
MLVRDCMTRHPILITPGTQAAEAQRVLSENNIRHLPVVGDGKKLKGLITRQRLQLEPDVMSSLDVWEITRYLSSLTVQKMMVPRAEVVTAVEDRTVERAARTMAEHKIGCMPVVDGDDVVVGIISEVDLLRAFQEMLGLPAAGVRVTMRMPHRPGEFNRLMSALAEQGWGVMGIGTFPSPRKENHYDAVIKIPKVSMEEVRGALSQVPDQEIVDIRDVV